MTCNTARFRVLAISLALVVTAAMPASAQTPPGRSAIAGYRGLHAAAWRGDVEAIRAEVSRGASLEARDSAGRTPLHVAAFASRDEAVRALAMAGADLDALEDRDYDIVTIAAVANDLALLDLALSLGASPANITSPYEGTALIAAAHLGHVAVVERLVAAGAPLDHVNNLGWTALMEAVVLGDGGADHVATVRALVNGGADVTIADRDGVAPLAHARARGYREIAAVLEQAP